MFAAIATVTLYLAAAGVLGAWAWSAKQRGRHGWLPFAVLAIIFHGELHAIAWRSASGPDMHFFAALSFSALGMAALTTTMALRGQMAALGVIVFPLAALFALLYHFTGPSTPTAMGWQLQLHVWSALLAYATLAIAAVLAVLLWLQERALRERRLHRWLRVLPPLTELETLLFRTITAGFALLSLALLAGALFVHDLFAQHLVHKTVLSLLAWAVFGLLLLGRWRRGWRGRKAVRLTLIAMLLLVLAFFGSKFAYDFLIHRG